MHLDATLFPDPTTFNLERPTTKDDRGRGEVHQSLDFLPRGPRTSSAGAVAITTIAKVMHEQFDFDRNRTSRTVANFKDNGRFGG